MVGASLRGLTGRLLPPGSLVIGRAGGGRVVEREAHALVDSVLSAVCFLRAPSSNRVIGGGRVFLLFSEWGFLSLLFCFLVQRLAIYLLINTLSQTGRTYYLLHIIMD